MNDMEKIVEAAIKVVEAYDKPVFDEFHDAIDVLKDAVADGYCKYPGHCACGGDALAVKKTCNNWRNV